MNWATCWTERVPGSNSVGIRTPYKTRSQWPSCEKKMAWGVRGKWRGGIATQRQWESLMTRYSKCWLSNPKARMMGGGGAKACICLRPLLKPHQAPAFPRDSQSRLTPMKSEATPAVNYEFCWQDNSSTETVITHLAREAHTIRTSYSALGFQA